jgi:hypothetical protein
MQAACERTQPYAAPSLAGGLTALTPPKAVGRKKSRIYHYRIYRLPNDKDLDSSKQGKASRVFDAEQLRSRNTFLCCQSQSYDAILTFSPFPLGGKTGSDVVAAAGQLRCARHKTPRALFFHYYAPHSHLLTILSATYH